MGGGLGQLLLAMPDLFIAEVCATHLSISEMCRLSQCCTAMLHVSFTDAFWLPKFEAQMWRLEPIPVPGRELRQRSVAAKTRQGTSSFRSPGCPRPPFSRDAHSTPWAYGAGGRKFLTTHP